PDLYLGASPRASLCLLRCARARAMLDGRHYFTHEDVWEIAQPVLGHRLIIRPEAEVEGKKTSDVVRELLEAVPALHEGRGPAVLECREDRRRLIVLFDPALRPRKQKPKDATLPARQNRHAH